MGGCVLERGGNAENWVENPTSKRAPLWFFTKNGTMEIRAENPREARFTAAFKPWFLAQIPPAVNTPFFTVNSVWEVSSTKRYWLLVYNKKNGKRAI